MLTGKTLPLTNSGSLSKTAFYRSPIMNPMKRLMFLKSWGLYRMAPDHVSDPKSKVPSVLAGVYPVCGP